MMRLGTVWGFVLVVVMALVGCAGTATPTPTEAVPSVQRLRIANLSDVPIEDLVLRFPSPTGAIELIRFPFGTVGAGEMTEYREIPGGVYRYAVYDYRVEGTVLTQPVTDFVGEKPMAGSAFTYQLSYDPRQPQGNQIQLVEVMVDEP